MKLKIKNIGKIEQADIEIKGITVIAGLNNTGKSTVSRSLFAMFHSFSNLSGKIRFEKEITIGNVLTTAHRFVGAFNPNNLSEFATILVGNIDENKIEEDLERLSIEPILMKDLVRDIKEVNATPDDLLISEIVSEIFGDEFNGHITNIRSSKESRVELKIKDFETKVIFDSSNKLVRIENEKELTQKIVYIDDPFIIDSYNLHERSSIRAGKSINHRTALIEQYKNTKNLTLVDKANLKEKLSKIYKKIDDTLGSDIELFEIGNNTGKAFENKGLSIDSLSSGMKTFYLIKSLIDNGTIVQNGTLILDEPEVHLHPDWQVTLSEIIVLLQREMGLHILINTHSPYFLRAIDVFSKKYETGDSVKYYLSYNEKDSSKMKDVTLSISEIYKVLTEPLQRIEFV